jgi:hypothetical protein
MTALLSYPFPVEVLVDEEIASSPQQPLQATPAMSVATNMPQAMTPTSLTVVFPGIFTTPMPSTTHSGEGDAESHSHLMQKQAISTRRRNCWVATSVALFIVCCLVLLPYLMFGVYIRAGDGKSTQHMLRLLVIRNSHDYVCEDVEMDPEP